MAISTTKTTASSALRWWRDAPADVRYVLALAYKRDGEQDAVHDDLLAGYPARTRTLVVDIADDLHLAELLGAGDEGTLRAVLGGDDPWHGAIYDRDEAFTRERDRYRERALSAARVVAMVRVAA